MGVVFTTEPKCLNSTQLQVRLCVEGVRVNVTMQFSWVITSLQSDKEAVWWVGIRRDHICSPPPTPSDSVALHQCAKSSVAEGTFLSAQLSIALTPNASS